MDGTTILETPRYETRGSILFAGLSARYHHGNLGGIMGQWGSFGPHLGKIPGQAGWKTYGICYNFDGTGNFDYMCAVEVSEAAPLPPPLTHLPVTEQNYAVFTHRGLISTIGKTWNAIYNDWPEKSGDALVHAPQFEAYAEDFNPRAETVVIEIWIPVQRKAAELTQV